MTTHPLLAAFLPAVILGGIWFGAAGALGVLAVALPVVAIATRDTGTPLRHASDAITGLPVEADLRRKLEQQCATSQGKDRAMCLLLLDIRNLKEIEARHGPGAADCALRTTAQRLTKATRSGDSCARLSDGTFAVLTARSRRITPQSAMAIGTRLQAGLEEQVPWDGGRLPVEMTSGLVLDTQFDGPDGQTLMEAALLARQEAGRESGARLALYSDTMRRSVEDRRDLAAELRQAFDDGQIEPWFQPQICAHTGRITGFEALARWQHPERGVVPPAQFLDAIETAGLMAKLGETMLFQALAALRAWDRAGVVVDTVGVNFSGAELRDPQLVERIRWELDRFDILPERLCVEVLESVVAEGAEDIICKTVEALSTLGCQIDLDDFGTGHASITNIRRFAITRLKIDRSFITGVDRDEESRRLTAAILTMAQQLGLETLAEGVETAQAEDTLRQMGCDYLQGFGIGRPMPFEDTIGWMNAQQRPSTATGTARKAEPQT